MAFGSRLPLQVHGASILDIERCEMPTLLPLTLIFFPLLFDSDCSDYIVELGLLRLQFLASKSLIAIRVARAAVPKSARIFEQDSGTAKIRVHAQGGVRQHSVLRRVLRRFWEGFWGMDSQKGSEKGGLLWVLQ